MGWEDEAKLWISVSSSTPNSLQSTSALLGASSGSARRSSSPEDEQDPLEQEEDSEGEEDGDLGRGSSGFGTWVAFLF